MKSRALPLFILAGVLLLAAASAWLILTAPRNPVALLRVTDGAGKPIANAVIHPEGLRTKPGPYAGGWYNWKMGKGPAPDSPVTTDAQGYGSLPYPKYVFERIETGVVCLSVDHPEYAPARPECRVTVAPPARAPWRVWFDYLQDRIRHKALIAPTEPIVLQQGAVLELSLKQGSGQPNGSPFSAQISGERIDSKDFWLRPAPGVLVTRRLTPGQTTVRAVQFDSSGRAWFSDLAAFMAVAGRTNELTVELKPGRAVHGRLDQGVPRPVRDGRVIANVWPRNEAPSASPPQWHAWTNIEADGSFVIPSLPEGDLELVALCDGFVSTNGPGKFHFHYPQKFSLEGADLDVVIGMEPTASIEVTVQDDQGKALSGARISTWPNVRYGEWGATIIGEDCFNTADWLKSAATKESLGQWWLSRHTLFTATSDVAGLAVLRNIPVEADSFTVEHERFVLPAVDTGLGQKRRQSALVLRPGQTNQVTVRLEPIAQSPIAHY